MSQANRPLSPHIQIYKRQITSVLSILHRITGIVLAGGAILVALWFVSLAHHADLSVRLLDLLGTAPGLVFLFLWTLALFFHLCNGIRHLVWDAGRGFEMYQVVRSGWAVVASSVILTLAVWTVGLTVCA